MNSTDNKALETHEIDNFVKEIRFEIRKRVEIKSNLYDYDFSQDIAILNNIRFSWDNELCGQSSKSSFSDDLSRAVSFRKYN